MDRKVAEEFGGRIRIRACGLCFKGDTILLINHVGVYGHDFWAPPGGGVNFGETIERTLVREFEEECRTSINIGKFLFGCEFIKPPFHALELFYEVENLNSPRLGVDPELADRQVISELKFMGKKDVKSLGHNQVHAIFHRVDNPKELRRLSGFFGLT